jgi:hypothetical protein
MAVQILSGALPMNCRCKTAPHRPQRQCSSHYAFAFAYADQLHATDAGLFGGTSLKLGTFIVEFHDLIAFVIEQDRITAG